MAVALLAGGPYAQPSPPPPAPAMVLGFEPGTDYRLADYVQLREYFHRLDRTSDRVRLFVAGRSTGGNDLLVAAISSAENLARLDEYRDIARRLALVRGVSDADARRLAARGRAVVWIDNGLHASEVAAPQHALTLAHRLASDESPAIQAVRENVIVLLLPSVNPDGMQMVVDWYRRHRGTPYQDSPLPWLYQAFAGHDNNRDFFMQTQTETRVLNRLLYREWLPQVVYNHHQGIFPPRMFVPPFPEPINPHIDLQVMRGVDAIGAAMQRRLEAERRDGVVSRYAFSAWYNGSIRTASYFHNMLGILSEVSHASATPFRYDPRTLPAVLSNGVSARDPSATYPRPWQGGLLRLRDAVDYMLSGSLAVLEYAAEHREELLLGIHQMGERQIRLGASGPPVAYVLPPDQHDRSAVRAFVDVLLSGGVDVHRAARAFSADGRTYPAGAYVIQLAQPFRPFVRDLIEPHAYPDLRDAATGQPLPPYDAAGWTLSYQMGIRVDAVKRSLETGALEPLRELPASRPQVHGLNPDEVWGYVIEPTANASFQAVNRMLDAELAVERLTDPFSPRDGVSLPAGAWLVPRESGAVGPDGPAGPRATRSDPIERIEAVPAVRVWAVDRRPPVPAAAVHRARVGVYRSWVAGIDEGWLRWVLEQYGFPYVTLVDRDIRGGRLADRVDVLVLPSQEADRILKGHQESDGPPQPGPWGPVPPEYRGGIGEEGLRALREFVSGGGTLVAIDEASDLVLLRFGGLFRAVSRTTDGVGKEAFYCPGSVLRITTQASHPAAWGMAPEAAAFFQQSRAFWTSHREVRSLARYAGEGRVLMSGWLLGERYVAGQEAVVEVPYGRGRVFLFGFRPHFRAQSHGTFKLLFNLLLRTDRARSSAPPTTPSETASAVSASPLLRAEPCCR